MSSRGNLQRAQIHGHFELRHLCEIAQDEQGWEKVRNWFLSHTELQSQNAVSRKGENGTTAIHMACKSSAPLDIIEMFINACEDSLEFKDDYGWRPLHYVCHYGASEEVLKVFIQSRPRTLKDEDSKGRNPLHFAVGNKCKDVPFTTSIFNMLIQGAAERQVDGKGMLPIHYSCAYGTASEVIKLLIEAFPESIYCTDDNGFTPLHYAMGNCERDESPGAIAVLLSKVSQVSKDDATGTIGRQEQKHPLLVFADRTKTFKDISVKGLENAQSCLQVYLRKKPVASTNFFTALQSLPPWLEDHAVVEPYVQEQLNIKISKKFPTAIMILDFYMIVITLGTFIKAVIDSIDNRAENSNGSDSKPILIFLYITCIYLAVREFVQVLSFIHLGLFFSSWFKRATNWMEISLIIQVLFWTIVIETGIMSLDHFRTGTAITLFFLWMNFLNYLRGMIVEFAVFVSGVIHVLQRLGVFLMALLIILLAFSQIFFTLFIASTYCEGFEQDRSHVETCDPEGGDPYRFCTQWDSFLSVYTMLLGEVDESDFKMSLLATILYVLFVFLVVILLANVLIAIVTDSYSVIRNERAAIVFWTNRLDFIVEMNVISDGPVMRRVKSIFCGNRDDSTEDHENGIASTIWMHIMELFDKNGPYLQVDTCSMAFICLNFLRTIAILIMIPLWIILGLVSAGLFWPPQIREKLMKQKISRKRSRAVVKYEQQKNEVRKLKDSVATFRYELTKSLTRQKEQAKEIKTEISTLHSEVISEMHNVQQTLETLLELQNSRG